MSVVNYNYLLKSFSYLQILNMTVSLVDLSVKPRNGWLIKVDAMHLESAARSRFGSSLIGHDLK